MSHHASARKPRLPSQFESYYTNEAPTEETPAEVEGYYASYALERPRGFERPFTPMEEAFFNAGDELSEQHAEQLPTTRFAPGAPRAASPPAPSAPAAAKKPPTGKPHKSQKRAGAASTRRVARA